MDRLSKTDKRFIGFWVTVIVFCIALWVLVISAVLALVAS